MHFCPIVLHDEINPTRILAAKTLCDIRALDDFWFLLYFYSISSVNRKRNETVLLLLLLLLLLTNQQNPASYVLYKSQYRVHCSPKCSLDFGRMFLYMCIFPVQSSVPTSKSLLHTTTTTTIASSSNSSNSGEHQSNFRWSLLHFPLT